MSSIVRKYLEKGGTKPGKKRSLQDITPDTYLNVELTPEKMKQINERLEVLKKYDKMINRAFRRPSPTELSHKVINYDPNR